MAKRAGRDSKMGIKRRISTNNSKVDEVDTLDTPLFRKKIVKLKAHLSKKTPF